MGSIYSAENSCPEAKNLPFHSISNRNIIFQGSSLLHGSSQENEIVPMAGVSIFFSVRSLLFTQQKMLFTVDAWFSSIQISFIYYCHWVIRFRSDSVLPVVPARGVAEVALGLYCKTLFIYRTCVHPVLPRPARVPCVKHTLIVQCNTKRHFALQRAHLKLHLSHARSILHTPHFTLHLISSQLFPSHLRI